MIRCLLAAAVLVTACADDEPKAPDAKSEPVVRETEPPPPSPEVRLGPVVLPPSVPALAAAVLVSRSRDSLAASLTALDPFVGGESVVPTTVQAIDEYLAGRLGVSPVGARQVTLFVLPGEPQVAAIVQGASVGSQRRGASVGAVGGVALHRVSGEEIVAATVEDTLIVGHRAAVEASLGAAQGSTPRLAGSGGKLDDLVRRHGSDSSYAFAFSTAGLPTDIAAALTGYGISHGVAVLGPDGIHVAVRGDHDQLSRLGARVATDLAAAKATVAERKDAAMGLDDPAEVVAWLLAEQAVARAADSLTTTMQDGELVLRLPVRTEALAALAPLAMTLSAAGVAAISKSVRRPKTDEARVQVARMFDASSSYFVDDHITVEVLPSGSTVSTKRHLCPNDGRDRGESGITPPLTVDCSATASGQCVPESGAPKEPGHYEVELWTDNPVWKGLGFEQRDPHRFHYNFRYENFPGTYGGCQFTAQAFGDLDGDGVWSTYERVGVAGEDGISAPKGLVVEQPLE